LWHLKSWTRKCLDKVRQCRVVLAVEPAARNAVERSLKAPDFTGWDKNNAKFEAQLERVIKALRADGKARQPPPKPRL